jgi:glucokinase
MILAGDLGATKTLLGLFDPLPLRPRPIVVCQYETLAHGDLIEVIAEFVADSRVRTATIERACLGVAGPVIGDSAALTNVPWRVESHRIAHTFDIPRVSLLNDLEAMAYAVPLLHEHELHPLQRGEALRGGNIALIAAGTGLGEALLHHVNGRFIPVPSEGGHADFAARTEREIGLLRDLTARFGRADVERVVSGLGLVNLHRFTHHEPCPIVGSLDDRDAPARISAAAFAGECPHCMTALEMFAEAYGAETGNLALRSVATGGVFVGGGIARKILPALTDGRFIQAFLEKSPFEEMLRRMPVNVIMMPEVALLGAATCAAGA